MNRKILQRRTDRRGMIIFLVAIVITILSLGAFALFATISMERNATYVRGNEIQVNSAAQSGTEFVRAVCNATKAEQTQMGGLANNPRLFAAVKVNTAYQGGRQNVFCFTVLSPKINFIGSGSTLNGVQYGLQNESARLHLDTILKWESESPGQGRRALLTLPGMTPTAADSILDWIDPDKRARTSGAEIDYYQRIGVPYGPRNAIPVSLEELLLVRGVNRFLLFGTDESFTYGFSELAAKNNAGMGTSTGINTGPSVSRATAVPSISVPEIPEPGETEPEMSAQIPPEFITLDAHSPETDSDALSALQSGGNLDSSVLETGALDSQTGIPESATSSILSDSSGFSSMRSEHGIPWTYLLTTLSAEKEANPSGFAKYYLNDSNTEYLGQQITQSVDQQAAEFVLLCRNLTGNQNVPLETPIDLLTAILPEGTVNPFAQSSSQNSLQSNLQSSLQGNLQGGSSGRERFYKLLDYGTTNQDAVLTGRININEAPPEVLRAIPGFSDSLVSQIVARRSSLLAAGRQNELRHSIWLYYEQLVDLEQMKSLWPILTCGGDVYRCQVVGFLEGQGTTSRFEIVVDSTVRPPRQIFFKDLTMYGRGFPESVLNPKK